MRPAEVRTFNASGTRQGAECGASLLVLVTGELLVCPFTTVKVPSAEHHYSYSAP
jgi:hypothetical protein